MLIVISLTTLTALSAAQETSQTNYEPYEGPETGKQLYIYADIDEWPETNNFELRSLANRYSGEIGYRPTRNVCEIYYHKEDDSMFGGGSEGQTLRTYETGTRIVYDQDTFRHGGGFRFETQRHKVNEVRAPSVQDREHNAYELFNTISSDSEVDGTGLDGRTISNTGNTGELKRQTQQEGFNILYGDLLCHRPGYDEEAEWHICTEKQDNKKIIEDGVEWTCEGETGRWETEPSSFEGLKSPHRGGMNQAPENTLMAFENTRLMGIESAEFDIRMTADEKVVVHHDGTLQRRTHTGENIEDPVDEYDLEEITGIKAEAEYFEKNEEGNSYRGAPHKTTNDIYNYTIASEQGHIIEGVDPSQAKIPSFRETLEYFDEHNMVPRIDLKPGVRDSSEAAETVHSMVEGKGMTESSVYIAFPSSCDEPGRLRSVLGASKSCEWEALNTIEEESGGESVTAALYGDNPKEIEHVYREAEDVGIDIIGVDWTEFEDECGRTAFVEETHDRGFGVTFLSVPGDEDVKKQELAYNPVWSSTNVPEWVEKQVEEFEQDQLSGREYFDRCSPQEAGSTPSTEIAEELRENSGNFERPLRYDELEYVQTEETSERSNLISRFIDEGWTSYCESKGYDTESASDRLKCVEDGLLGECFTEDQTEGCEEITQGVCEYYNLGSYDPEKQTCEGAEEVNVNG